MAGRYYVDTSAYLCILLNEAGRQALEQELRGGEMLASVLLVLEARRNLIRLSREGTLPAGPLQDCLQRIDEDIQRFALRDLTLDLCMDAAMPVVSTPRSLDLAHLGTALWFHRQRPLTRFVTLDEPQVQAARELGLPT